ncbi:hypothetical protein D3C72_1084810 [compost metagenome]
MHSENLSEEVMIAIPLAPVIQGNNKEIASLQGLEPRTAILLASDSIAQRAVQSAQN